MIRIINLFSPNYLFHRSNFIFFQFSSFQSLSHVQLFATPWTAACHASLSITNSQSLLKLMFIKSVIPSDHLILCRPLLHLPLIFLSIRVFSKESVLCIRWPKYWSFTYVYWAVSSRQIFSRWLMSQDHVFIEVREMNNQMNSALVICFRVMELWMDSFTG